MIREKSKVITIFFLFLLLFFAAFSLSRANSFQDLNIGPRKVNPGSIFYVVKRIWEKGKVRLTRNHDKKISLYESLIEDRLSELNYVVENKKLSQMEKSSSRLSYFLGTLSEYLEENGSQEEKEGVKQKYQTYLEPLATMRDEFPANTSNWMIVQYCIDSINDYIQKLSS